MLIHSKTSKWIILSLLASVAALPAFSSAGTTADANQGTFKVINGFTGGWGGPGLLTEVSPGMFYGFSSLSGTSLYLGTAYSMTSTGALNVFYQFPGNWEVAGNQVAQAVNGSIYSGSVGMPGVPNDTVSLDGSGKVQTYPVTGLPGSPFFSAQSPDGFVYGTFADNFTPLTPGAFVKMDLKGNITILHSFSAAEGVPFGYPLLANDGNFYGISAISNTMAMVYKITPAGTLTQVAAYQNLARNISPTTFQVRLIQGVNGKLYGTTPMGGKYQGGSIFELTLDGQFTTIYSFPNYLTGIPSWLLQASDGNLYGSAFGQVQLGGQSSLFRISSTGAFQTIHKMINFNQGQCLCIFMQGSDGLFYGSAANAGAGNIGTAWTYDLGLPKPQPVVSVSYPSSGSVAAKVLFEGRNLLGATTVSFNGVPATVFGNISVNYVYAQVPAGATTGPVIVTTPNGAANLTFTVN